MVSRRKEFVEVHRHCGSSHGNGKVACLTVRLTIARVPNRSDGLSVTNVQEDATFMWLLWLLILAGAAGGFVAACRAMMRYSYPFAGTWPPG